MLTLNLAVCEVMANFLSRDDDVTGHMARKQDGGQRVWSVRLTDYVTQVCCFMKTVWLHLFQRCSI